MKKKQKNYIKNLINLLIYSALFFTSTLLFKEMIQIESILTAQNKNQKSREEYEKDLKSIYLADIPRDHAYIRGLDIQDKVSDSDVNIAKELSNYFPSGRNFIIIMRSYKNKDDRIYDFWDKKARNLFNETNYNKIINEVNTNYYEIE